MPRYFFHVIDGSSARDAEGTELADIYAAQDQAVRASGEIIRDLGAKLWNDAEWKMEVTDERDRILLTLRFSAEEHPGLGDPSPTRGST